MKLFGDSSLKPTGRLAIFTLSILASLLLSFYALTHFTIIDVFQNPIAYTIADEKIYVLERENNRLLQLEYRSAQQPLLLQAGFDLVAPGPGCVFIHFDLRICCEQHGNRGGIAGGNANNACSERALPSSLHKIADGALL